MNRILVWTYVLVAISGSFFLFCSQGVCTERVVSGQIKKVTLYRDRALVTREIKLLKGEGSNSITVDDLPPQLIEDSLFATAPAPVVIRAIRVSVISDTPESSPEAKALEAELKVAYRQRGLLESEKLVLTQNSSTLAKVVSFSAKSGAIDLGRGVLDAQALKDLAQFSMEQQISLARQLYDKQTELNEIGNQINTLVNKLEDIEFADVSSHFRAQISVDNLADQDVTIRLSYLVRECGWSPQYSIRGQTENSTLGLRYSAIVNQSTGEPWTDVELVLSTTIPSADARRPILTPLRVKSVEVRSRSTQNGKKLDDPFAVGRDATQNLLSDDESRARLTDLMNAHRRTVASGKKRKERDVQLNKLAGVLQQIELRAKSRSLRTLAIDANYDLANQIYEIERLVNIESRPEQQLIQILDTSLDADMYFVATPLLSSFAYRQATMTNSLKVGLLSGMASVYLDDRFVGREQIPSTAQGQKLTVGFGIDPQVRTRRELLTKTDRVKGGNRQIQFDYRLVISNFKDRPVVIRLVDRIPVAMETDQLAVAIETSKHPLSEDSLYVRLSRPLGILRWDATVPAMQIGADAFDVQYSCTLEFDRNRLPTTQHSLNEIAADYEESLNRGGGGFGGGGVF